LSAFGLASADGAITANFSAADVRRRNRQELWMAGS
jgi:hypothetical protein